MTVRVRIAPSPTGDPHVGTAYMALFNLITARKHGGTFILRVEDTDQKRSRPEYEQMVFDALKWAGIEWDEGPDRGGPFGPYRQSERTEIYREHAQILLDKEKAYKCFCTQQELEERRQVMAKTGGRQGYDRHCRNLSHQEIQDNLDAGKPYVIRLKVPLKGECVFQDAIRGRVAFPWADVDDQVLLKSDGFPTYHLANVVDDHLMEITHVIRGDEWLSSTPKHILLYDCFGWKVPEFRHMPLLLGMDGKKLSKRKNPTSILFYRDSGYLPEAFVNFMTLMCYSMPGDREIYTLDEIIREFDEKRIGTSGAVFDVKKLDWLNQQYIINNIPENKLWERLQQWQFNEAFMQKLMPLVHTRIKNFGEFIELCDFFFINHLNYTQEMFAPKEMTLEQTALVIQCIIWSMEEMNDFGSQGIETASKAVSEMFGINHKKKVMPLLFASIMGKQQGPPLFSSVEILGKDRTRARLLSAIEFCGGISNKKMQELKKCFDKKDCKELI